MEIKKFGELKDSAIFVAAKFSATDLRKDNDGLLRIYSNCNRAHGRYVKVGEMALHVPSNGKKRSAEDSIKAFSFVEDILVGQSETLVSMSERAMHRHNKFSTQSPAGRLLGKFLEHTAAARTTSEAFISAQVLKQLLPNLSHEALEKELTGLRFLGYIDILDDGSILLLGDGAIRAFELGFTTRFQRVQAVKRRS